MGIKKIYLIVILVTFSLNLFGQQDSVIVLDSTYSYYWHSQTSEWVLDGRNIYAYDANGNRAEYIAFFSWDSNTNDWINDLKTTSFWSELTASVSGYNIDHILKVYPNPFTDFSTIKLSNGAQIRKIELIDTNGRILKSIDNINCYSITIHREDLPGGIYFIRIHSNDTYVKQVIIMQQ